MYLLNKWALSPFYIICLFAKYLPFISACLYACLYAFIIFCSGASCFTIYFKEIFLSIFRAEALNPRRFLELESAGKGSSESSFLAA
jgi:hypothetical protein